VYTTSGLAAYMYIVHLQRYGRQHDRQIDVKVPQKTIIYLEALAYLNWCRTQVAYWKPYYGCSPWRSRDLVTSSAVQLQTWSSAWWRSEREN